jgi:GTPase KRas protein
MRGIQKSALTMQFVNNQFMDEYDPTIEDAYQRQCMIDSEPALLDILDTAGMLFFKSLCLDSVFSLISSLWRSGNERMDASCDLNRRHSLGMHDNKIGQEEYSAMRETYMRSGEGFLLIYSVTSRASYEELRDIQRQILRVKDRDFFPIILVANKCDMEQDRVVTVDDGKALAKEFRCRYVETSARLRVNVDEAFQFLVRSIREDNKRVSGNMEAANAAAGKSGKNKLKKRFKCSIL